MIRILNDIVKIRKELLRMTLILHATFILLLPRKNNEVDFAYLDNMNHWFQHQYLCDITSSSKNRLHIFLKKFHF